MEMKSRWFGLESLLVKNSTKLSKQFQRFTMGFVMGLPSNANGLFGRYHFSALVSP